MVALLSALSSWLNSSLHSSNPSSLSNTPSGNSIIDDADIDQIQYIPADGQLWQHTTWDYRYYQTTISSCFQEGCSIVFPFVGECYCNYLLYSSSG